MVLAEVSFEGVVVDVVLRLSTSITTITQVTTLVAVTAVDVQLIIAVEALATEAALGVALETGLVAGVVVAELLVSAQLGGSEKIVLVGEHLLVAGTEVAHLLVVDTFDMAVQVGPAETGSIAGGVGAVVAQQEDSVFEDVLLLVVDTQVVVDMGKVLGLVVFEAFVGVIGEDDLLGASLRES